MIDFRTEIDWMLIRQIEGGEVPDIAWDEYGRE